MAAVTANLGAQRPLRLVGGRWKRWSARGRVTVAAAPLLLIAVMIVGSAVACGVATIPLAVACLLVDPRWLHGRLRAVWWRVLWPWDARAGGLVRIAELGVERDQDYRPTATESAPVLARIDVAEHGRTYTVRPLPGQSMADFEMAIPLLTTRWKASQVTVRPAARRGLVVVDVTPGDAVGSQAPIPGDALPWQS